MDNWLAGQDGWRFFEKDGHGKELMNYTGEERAPLLFSVAGLAVALVAVILFFILNKTPDKAPSPPVNPPLVGSGTGDDPGEKIFLMRGTGRAVVGRENLSEESFRGVAGELVPGGPVETLAQMRHRIVYRIDETLA